jgi:methylenetetrahydrofolate reductase (NADPH)
VREIEAVAGLHIMAYRQQDLVPEIVAEAGLLPRPVHEPKKEIIHAHVTG